MCKRSMLKTDDFDYARTHAHSRGLDISHIASNTLKRVVRKSGVRSVVIIYGDDNSKRGRIPLSLRFFKFSIFCTLGQKVCLFSARLCILLHTRYLSVLLVHFEMLFFLNSCTTHKMRESHK